MRLIHAIAASALLGAAAGAVRERIPMHKRFSYDVLINDFSYLGMLAKRDECSDAFGSNARNSNCSPDFTLCCTRLRQAYPSCEKFVGKGWCCIGEAEDEYCYVDQASACDESGSVSCSRLQVGASRACCPQGTECDSNTDASPTYVRCNIKRGDLLASAKSLTESTSSTEAPSSTSTQDAKTTGPESQTADPGDKNQSSGSEGLSAGAIGGIAGGTIFVVGLAAGVGIFFFMRRKNKPKYQAANQSPHPSIPQYYHDQQLKYNEQGYWQGAPQQGGYMYSQPPSELMAQGPPVELDNTHYPQQYQQQYQGQDQFQQQGQFQQGEQLQQHPSHQQSPPPQQQSPPPTQQR